MYIEFPVYFLWALLILVLPLPWLTASLFAAAFHESCHLLCIRLMKGHVAGFHIGAGGAVIDTALPGTGQELLCALAGPAGSFLLAAMGHWFPRIGLCALIQGLFNLIPLFPLDGGRAVQCLLRMLWPDKADSFRKILDRVVSGILLLMALILSFLFSLGILPLIMAALLLLKRKSPCKASKIRVQ